MNIAITGASGYVGSRLTEKMSAGPNKLRCLVRDKTAFVERFNHQLIEAKEQDLYLSSVSPLGVPFNNLRNASKEVEKWKKVEE